MKYLFILLFIASGFSQYLPDTSNMSETEKFLLYEINKKNTSTAVIYSVFVPSLGYVYSENWLNWGRGPLFLIGRTSTSIVTFMAILQESAIEAVVAGGLYIVLTTLELIDVRKKVEKYNKNLHRNIFGKNQPSLSLNLQPTYNGANLNLSYNF